MSYPSLEGAVFEIRSRTPPRPDIIATIGKISAMPTGKRKYILLHKRAYDNYKKLKAVPPIGRTQQQAFQIVELHELMEKLRIKINGNEKLKTNYKLYTTGSLASDIDAKLQGIYARGYLHTASRSK